MYAQEYIHLCSHNLSVVYVIVYEYYIGSVWGLFITIEHVHDCFVLAIGWAQSKYDRSSLAHMSIGTQ